MQKVEDNGGWLYRYFNAEILWNNFRCDSAGISVAQLIYAINLDAYRLFRGSGTMVCTVEWKSTVIFHARFAYLFAILLVFMTTASLNTSVRRQRYRLLCQLFVSTITALRQKRSFTRSRCRHDHVEQYACQERLLSIFFVWPSHISN